VTALRILVYEFDQTKLQEVCQGLQQERPEWTIHGTADAMHAYSAVDSGKFYDVILTEYAGADAGRDFLSTISYYCPHTATIVHSPMLNARSLVAIRRFARAHLCKPAPLSAVIKAIEAAVPVRTEHGETLVASDVNTPPYLLRCIGATPTKRKRPRLLQTLGVGERRPA
jgi:hypothetical protein